MGRIKSVYSCLFMRVRLKAEELKREASSVQALPGTHDRKARFTLVIFASFSASTPPRSVKHCEWQRSVEMKSYRYLQARGGKTGPVPTSHRSLALLC